MSGAAVIHYEHGIHVVDAEYLRPGLAAIHLVLQDGHAAIVDTGTGHAVPRVLAALAGLGVSPEAVDYVIVTHVHLDHAGAAGALLRACPNARLVAHPKGARHLVDPARLVAGSIAVYGESVFRDLYGEIVPVAADRVIEAGDGHELDFRGRPFVFLDTPGHARHHFCLWDRTSEGVFSGDTFGIAYREFEVDGRPFLFPTTTPVQFEPEALHQSIDRLMALQPRSAYLTHFGRIEQPARHAAGLHARIDALVELAHAAPGTGATRQDWLETRIEAMLLAGLRAHGCTLTEAEIRSRLANDVNLNAQGLAVWLDRMNEGQA
jgi:glyoxylase-like metal-dependent hydrolase (beta-lactamase superfamily II)